MNDMLLRDAVAYADRWLSYQQRLHEIPAITFAVRHRDDLILSTAHGHANLEAGIPVTPQHIFRVASHSKWFTATAILQLSEQGKLRLDDRLGQFIPWLQGSIAAATVREALNHAAGITRDGYDNDHWQLAHPFPDVAQLQELVERDGAVLERNRMLKYSNIGYSLLGLVIEAASGLPYHRYMQDHIVEPLGLQSTGPETNEQAQSRMVTGYSSRGLLLPRMPLPDVETGAMAAATGFYSTAEDLTRFAAAHFYGNETLISDAAKREMHRPYWMVSDMESYGLGTTVMSVGKRQLPGHSGGFPGHSTRTVLDPEDQFAISLLTSESAGAAGDLVRAVVKLIDLALDQEPCESTEALDRYTGRFTSLWDYVDIVRLGNRLFQFAPQVDDPAAVATALSVVDADTLRIEEKAGYGSPGELVRYERDDTGAVRKVIMAGSTQYPEGENAADLQGRREELAARVRSGR